MQEQQNMNNGNLEIRSSFPVPFSFSGIEFLFLHPLPLRNGAKTKSFIS
jgi:hypothetical protein